MTNAVDRYLEQFAEDYAKLVKRHGIKPITPEHLRERVLHYLDVAKKELEACGPEESNDRSNFTPTVTIFGPGGEEGNVPIGFTPDTKQAKMEAVSLMCETLMVQALILRIVGTGGNVQKIAQAMEVNLPDPRDRQKMRYFEEKMFRWIRQRYGAHRLASLPPEFRKDHIIVGAMGPKVPEIGVSLEYRWESGKLVFDDHGGHTTDPDHMEMRLGMIPRWWQ